MTTTLTAACEIADLARHLRLSDPFQSNRVSDASGSLPPNVAGLHRAELEHLSDLVALARDHKGGIGAMLWGEPGIGKTHLLNRLRREFQDKACVITLHNVQASPERLSRYVLNSVVRQLARCQKGGLPRRSSELSSSRSG